MSTPYPPMISVAQRDGDRGPTQDREFGGHNLAIVLDGATQADAAARDGGWLAHHLGLTLGTRIFTDLDVDLADALADAITAMADRYDLSPDNSPSTTVSILRWTADLVEALVLGNSPIVVRTRDGHIHQVRDDRLTRLDGDQQDGDPQEQAATRRNQPGGYWIAEADPTAAHHAIRGSWPRSDVDTILVMTDGVADGVDRYGIPPDWATAVAMAVEDPLALVDLVHETEETDPDGIRWPRAKRHDDKTLAVVTRFNTG